MLRRTCIFLFILLNVALHLSGAKKPELPPAQDPADQLFRMAPMTKSSRSIVVNLSSGLYLAYDTQNMRVHTAWRGKASTYMVRATMAENDPLSAIQMDKCFGETHLFTHGCKTLTEFLKLNIPVLVL